MPDLQNSKIYRGGVTANYLQHETKKCSFRLNPNDNTIDFRFDLASKGGGTTSVLFQVGIEDLPAVLREVAEKMPEQVGVLSDCASLANKRNLELLEEARRVKGDEKARARKLVEKLEDVESFVTEKYREAPAGEDARETEVLDRIGNVINVLRNLSESEG